MSQIENIITNPEISNILNTKNISTFNPWENKIDILNSKEHTTDFIIFLKEENIHKTQESKISYINGYNNNLKELNQSIELNHTINTINDLSTIRYNNKVEINTNANTNNAYTYNSTEIIDNHNMDNLNIINTNDINEINNEESKFQFKDSAILLLLGKINISINYYYMNLLILEELFEKYKFKNILSQDLEVLDQDALINITNTLSLINDSKITLLNLLKNSHLTETSCIHIYYESQNKLLFVLKSIFSLLDVSSEINYITEFRQLNSNSIERIFDSINILIYYFKRKIKEKIDIEYMVVQQ